MGSISLEVMRQYLSQSISSLNKNKINGILAEIDFRNYLDTIGHGERVSAGGWIVRKVGPQEFGHHTAAFFPITIGVDFDYTSVERLPQPDHGLHTICSTLHQIGIHSYFCAPVIKTTDDTNSIQWHSVQLGLPSQQQYRPFPSQVDGFSERTRKYNFLRYKTDTRGIPEEFVPDQFSKEQIRVVFQNMYMSEMSDIDGILWGERYTYPLEIKEKTAASDNKTGPYFGLDVGPFVKLAFYSAKRGNLHSIFIVREIDNVESRNLVSWWFITYEELAKYASWNQVGGGTNMQGGRSSVVKIPKAEFQELTTETIKQL